MQRDAKYIFRLGMIIGLFLIIGGYAIYQASKLIEGPRLTITTPKNGQTVHDSLLGIEGVAKNINTISLNDRPIFIDEAGNFKEKLLLFPGYNIMKIEAGDKFGKKKILILEINYEATTSPPPTLLNTATTSTSTATSSKI